MESEKQITDTLQSAAKCVRTNTSEEGKTESLGGSKLAKEAARPNEVLELECDWKVAEQNALNWSPVRRWSLVVSIALSNCIASMAVTAFEPAIPTIMQDFDSQSPTISSLTVSIYLLGYIVGPLLVAPVSELYGQAIVLRIGFLLLVISLAGSGASTGIAMFIVFRAIGGFGQIALLLMANALVADLIPVERRGIGMSVILMGPGIGPTIGPITGGYIVEHIDWRWLFWVYLIAASTLGALIILVYHESYAPILRARWMIHQHFHDDLLGARRPSPAEKKAELRAAWVRPLKLFLRSPVTILLTFTTSVANGYFILALTILGTVFQDAYGFTASQSGLAYLGMAVGLVFSEVTAGYFSDRFVRIMMAKSEGESKPEQRLPLLLVGGAVLPAGFLLYGWTVEYQTHFILPIIGSAIIAAGVMYNYMPSQLYLVDCFTVHTVSATGAASVVRSIVSVVLPLAANAMYSSLGYGWGNSLLAFIALLNVPIAVVLLRYGETIRTRFEVKL